MECSKSNKESGHDCRERSPHCACRAGALFARRLRRSFDGRHRTLRTVSVKTIYGHFRSKDELFSKVMIEACTDHLLSGEPPSDEALGERFVWYRKATQRGLFEAGREYLGHLLSEEQLALYRVVTGDADRFPALGRQYHENFARGRTGILVAYLKSVGRRKSWKTSTGTRCCSL